MTPLLLLPGMMCDARLFQPQFAAFSAHRPMMSVPIGNAETMTGIADAVLNEAPERFALAGLSMGGIVAMEIIRLAPHRVAGLALLDTNHHAEKSEVKALRETQMQAVRNGKLQSVVRDDLKPNYLADGPHRASILDLCMEMAMDLGDEVFVRQSRALMSRKDQTATLAEFTGPALVLCGAQDLLCPPERHRSMHALIAGSRLEVVPDAGHMPVLENPEHTNRALAHWLEAI